MKKETLKSLINTLIKPLGNLKAVDFNPLMHEIVDATTIEIPTLSVLLKQPRELKDYKIDDDPTLQHFDNQTKVMIAINNNGSELWKEYNPKVFLFSKGRARKKWNGYKTNLSANRWCHPSCNTYGSLTAATYPKQLYRHFRLPEYAISFDNLFQSVFELSQLDNSKQPLIGFNPKYFFYYYDRYSNIADMGKLKYPVPIDLNFPGISIEFWDNIFPFNGRSKERNSKVNKCAYFRFAIGIENPNDSHLHPILFGPMSDIIVFKNRKSENVPKKMIANMCIGTII